ncbi:MAG: zf-HC2 domain-containing protein [Acidobacteria bacterium]|nr:zf-HC2 domain-containing protein [Acidobacteriota bacterium]
MDCKEIRNLLPLFQRGLLDADTAKAVSGHLVSCAQCREALELENRISAGLDSLFDGKADEMKLSGIADRVLEESTGEKPVSDVRFPVKRVFYGGALAATVVFALLFSFLFHHTSISEINLIREAPVRTALLNHSPVRAPEIRDIQRKTTVTRLKENVVWISYKN